MSDRVASALEDLASAFYELDVKTGRRQVGRARSGVRARKANQSGEGGGSGRRRTAFEGANSMSAGEATSGIGGHRASVVRASKPVEGSGGGGQGNATLGRTVRRSTEVVVKISGSGSNLKQIVKSVDYIARRGKEEVPIEDERGHVHVGEQATGNALRAWTGAVAEPIPREGGYRRESLNLVLSMPAGTDREAVEHAAREFAAGVFGTNHPYVLASHRDTDHTHVHIIVRVSGTDGHRLDPRKKDLYEWRHAFAAELRDMGHDANATYRDVRGVTERSVSREVYHQRQAAARAEARATLSRIAREERKEALAAAAEGVLRTNPHEADLVRRREEVVRGYARMGNLLATGDDAQRAEAEQIKSFVLAMPPVGATRHARLVESIMNDAALQTGAERTSTAPARADPSTTSTTTERTGRDDLER